MLENEAPQAGAAAAGGCRLRRRRWVPPAPIVLEHNLRLAGQAAGSWPTPTCRRDRESVTAVEPET
jgi:hypothetical protein